MILENWMLFTAMIVKHVIIIFMFEMLTIIC